MCDMNAAILRVPIKSGCCGVAVPPKVKPQYEYAFILYGPTTTRLVLGESIVAVNSRLHATIDGICTLVSIMYPRSSRYYNLTIWYVALRSQPRATTFRAAPHAFVQQNMLLSVELFHSFRVAATTDTFGMICERAANL